MRYTVLGASGFIGSALVQALRAQGHECLAPARAELPGLLAGQRQLGHVFWCIGLTADFRQRPFETIRAHVCDLVPWLQTGRHDSFLYLSSTRVYGRSRSAQEGDALSVLPSEADDLYNLSKLTGEALCLALPETTTRVVRVSTVVGERADNHDFIGSLLSQGRAEGRLHLQSHWDSAKDYIALEDVVELLPRIAQAGAQRLYNLASGVNLTHRDVAHALAGRAGWTVTCEGQRAPMEFPPIDIEGIRAEFGFRPRDALARIGALSPARGGAPSPDRTNALSPDRGVLSEEIPIP